MYMPDFDPSTDDPQQGLNIQIDEDTAEGTYSNLVMISHSPEEFILDFIRVVPGVQQAKVKSRIIISPQHARRLVDALEENIDRYEQAHGEIDQRGGPNRPIQFGGPDAKA